VLLLNANGTVKNHQKISDTNGSFTGELNNTDRFGHSVADLGDLDGDGILDIAVGALQDDDGGPDLGAVWILSLNDSFGFVVRKQGSFAIKASGSVVEGIINESSVNAPLQQGFNYIALSYDGATEKLYVNGNLSANKSLPGSIPVNMNDLLIGNTFNGTIDDIVIWNRSLSAEQIQALFNNRTDLIVSNETSVGETWQAQVTPNDGTEDGGTLESNNITIAIILETAAPEVINVTAIPSVVNQTQTVNITANVTDNIGISAVLANITFPNSTSILRTMTLLSGDIFNVTFVPSLTDPPGVYNVTIIANDTSNNLNNTETTNFTVNDVTFPAIQLVDPTPPNASFLSQTFIPANVTATDNIAIDVIQLFLFNTTGQVQVNTSETAPSSSTQQSTTPATTKIKQKQEP